jgi:hypothetical protein
MLAALIPSLLPIIGDVLGRFLPEDKEAAAKARQEIEAQLTTHLAQIDLAQIAVNREDAKGNWFQSSWRPFIGWSCGMALAYTYVLQPIAVFVLGQTGHLIVLPTLSMSEMMPILMGLLGLGGLRTFEKFKRVAK